MRRSILTAALLATAVVLGGPGARTLSAQDTVPKPEFTPFTVAHQLLNRDEVRDALVQAYPPALRDQGIGGRVNVWFYITDRGRVQHKLLDESSGLDAIDEAAMEVADVFEFSPAKNHDESVAVWVSLPITFTPRQNDGR